MWIPAAGAELVGFSEGTLGMLGYVCTIDTYHDLTSLLLQSHLLHSGNAKSVASCEWQEVIAIAPTLVTPCTSCSGNVISIYLVYPVKVGVYWIGVQRTFPMNFARRTVGQAAALTAALVVNVDIPVELSPLALGQYYPGVRAVQVPEERYVLFNHAILHDL